MECNVKHGTIFYEAYGQGFPIIILHAMGTDHRAMEAWLEPVFLYNPGWKRYYLDVPAHGGSSIDASVNGTEDMLDMVLEFIDSVLPEQRFSLIGMSFGAYIAQGILHKRTELIDGICLVAPVVHMPGKDRVLPVNVKIETDEQLVKDMDPDIRQAIQALMVYQIQQSLERFIEEIQPGRLLTDRKFLSSNWRERYYHYSFEPLSNTDQLNQPALFLLGKQDVIAGYEDQMGLARKFNHGSIAILDRAGHLIPIDQRSLTQQLVGDWLQRVLTFSSTH